jgi:ppGpp synthetase/RelA/SpoT-type nucleotidyltranferase/tetrahydromethanopterin S-methyltransferase subunit F
MENISSLSEKDFLERNRISKEVWEASGLDWNSLLAIAVDYEKKQELLRNSAEAVAREIQRLSAVHSVRWRIKDAEHLLAKIVRKRADKSEKYAAIDVSNYFEVVTDLVGLRALHLFKDDCLSIHSELLGLWDPQETPIVYVRAGDSSDLLDRFEELGLQIKSHPAGYRSVHYIVANKVTRVNVLAEIQVRTIFEEGWSEIDHQIRYPNFSDDPQVLYFLTILNRLAGNADEMGTFVQSLTAALQQSSANLAQANAEKETALSAMDKMLTELKELKEQDAKSQAKIKSLQKEVEKIRKINSGGGPAHSAGELAGIEYGIDKATTLTRELTAMEVLAAAARPMDKIRSLVESARRTEGIFAGRDARLTFSGLVGETAADRLARIARLSPSEDARRLADQFLGASAADELTRISELSPSEDIRRPASQFLSESTVDKLARVVEPSSGEIRQKANPLATTTTAGNRKPGEGKE